MRTSTATNPGQELKPPTAQLATLKGDWRLVVSFHWRQDRFEHRILVVRDDQLASADSLSSAVLLAGVTPEPPISDISDWPVNPPIQQLDECTMTGRRRGLVGLGMAGTSHWSLAVEAGERELWFDVACRIQQPPGCLQSSYEVFEELQGSESEPSERKERPIVRLGSGAAGASIELQVERDSAELVCGGQLRQVRLRPIQLPDRFPATVRWRYGWVATA